MARFGNFKNYLRWKYIIMIFVTIGTQEPFDRLIRVMDKVAFALKGKETIIAQACGGSYIVQSMEIHDFLSPAEFGKLFNEARLIVSHAGMGTVISALTKQKPIVVMPRKLELAEHRNDHQLASAKKLAELKYINVVFNEDELVEKVMELVANPNLQPLHHLGESASDELLCSIRDFALS